MDHKPPWRFFALCYFTAFLMLVIGASRDMFVEEKHGAGMLMFLFFAPISVPLVFVFGVFACILRTIFWLGGLL